MPQRYKRHCESFGFLEKLYVLYYMKKLKTLFIYSFMMLFPDEASALRYIEKTLWGDLPICPYCNGTDTTIRRARKGHLCKKCRKDFTVRIGNVFESSNIDVYNSLIFYKLIFTNII